MALAAHHIHGLESYQAQTKLLYPLAYGSSSRPRYGGDLL